MKSLCPCGNNILPLREKLFQKASYHTFLFEKERWCFWSMESHTLQFAETWRKIVQDAIKPVPLYFSQRGRNSACIYFLFFDFKFHFNLALLVDVPFSFYERSEMEAWLSPNAEKVRFRQFPHCTCIKMFFRANEPPHLELFSTFNWLPVNSPTHSFKRRAETDHARITPTFTGKFTMCYTRKMLRHQVAGLIEQNQSLRDLWAVWMIFSQVLLDW